MTNNITNKIKSLLKKLRRLGYPVKKETIKSFSDPVCGMESNSDLISAEHNQETYFFCSDHCRKTFESDPTKYVKIK